MITLKHDTLSFAFPEFFQQLRRLVERHIQSVPPAFVLPANRDELVDEIGSMPFWTLNQNGAGKSAYESAFTDEGSAAVA